MAPIHNLSHSDIDVSSDGLDGFALSDIDVIFGELHQTKYILLINI